MSVAYLDKWHGRWLNYHELAEYLDCSERWIRSRVAEGMPSAIIAGRRKFKAQKAEKWLEGEGHMVRSGC